MITMNWEPMSRTEFDKIMTMAVKELSKEGKKLFSSVSIDPLIIKCIRNKKSDIESVFAVAKLSDFYLIYDDVEEEFAVGHTHSDSILRGWFLYGELELALRGLTYLSGEESH